MPCFFCGKRVSLVRQLTDADFCSDDHRKRYQELTRLALDRLLDAGQRLGAPQVRPETEPEPEAVPAVPQWAAEPVEARYEEPQQPQPQYAQPQYAEPRREAPAPPPPEPEAPPPQPEAERTTRRGWRPKNLGTDPVFVMPPAKREPVPPEVTYFASLECEARPVAAAPYMVELHVEPAFNAPASTTPDLHFGLRGSAFAREQAGRPTARSLPPRSGPGGGNGFHATTNLDSLTPRWETARIVADRQPAARPLIVSHTRPASRETFFRLAEAHGRAVPRPVLPRFRARRPWSGGFELSGPVPGTQPRSAGRGARRLATFDFLPFTGTVRSGALLSAAARANAIGAGAFQTFAVRTASAPAGRALAPAAVFHAVPSWSRHISALRGGAFAQAGYADVPSPRALRMAAQQRVAPASFLGSETLLPGYAFKPVAEIVLGAPPPVAEARLAGFPAATPLRAAIRAARAVAFGAVSVALPRLEAAAQGCGISVPELVPLGYPASVTARPAAMKRSAGGELALWQESEAALPQLLSRRIAAHLPVAASVAGMGMPMATRRRAVKAAGHVEAFSGFELAIPKGNPIAVARRELTQAVWASNPAGVPARGKAPQAVVIRAQFAPPEAIIEIPALAARPRLPRLPGGQTLPPATAQRPAPARFAPRTTSAAEFGPMAHIPECAIQFRERLTPGTYAPSEYPPALKGSRQGASANLDFARESASIPQLPIPAEAIRLAPAEAATRVPVPVAGRAATPRPPEVRAIQGPSDIFLPPAAISLTFAGAVAARSLQHVPLPATRPLPAAARVIAAQRIDCGMSLPPAPAHVSGTHLLPSAVSFPLPPRESKTKPPSAKPADWRLSVPQAAMARWNFVTMAPLGLIVPPAISGRIPGAGIRSTFRIADWLAPVPAAPAVKRDSAPLRPGTLGGASIERGAYLDPARRAPSAARALAAESPLATPETLLPRERTLAAREALDVVAAATVPPGSRAGAVPSTQTTAIGFRRRHELLPEIRIDSTLAQIAAARHIEECAAQPLATPALRTVSRPSGVQVAAVPVLLTDPLSRAATTISPIRPFTLASTELHALPQRRAWAVEFQRRDAELVGFAISDPIEPASGGTAARHTLEAAAPASVGGRSQAGAPRRACESVAAVSTQPVELAGPRALVFSHPLKAALASPVQIRGLNRAWSPIAAGWESLAQESATIEFEKMGTRAAGVCWPARTSFEFAPEPKTAARAGRAVRIEPRAAEPFAAPETRKPRSADCRPALGEAPVTKIATPAVRQDSRAARTMVRLEPLSRPHRHPSRLPVFHIEVEKAHMPSGAFHPIEIEDWDDDRTARIGSPCPTPPLEPWIPPTAFTLRAAEQLGEPLAAPVDAGPYPGTWTPAHVYGEQPFAFNLALIEDGAGLLKMDFEGIAETYSPRWRSALKSASGFFKGVMLVIPCMLVMSAMLSGCSGNGHSMKENIQNRATVHLEHDFAKGLDGWYGGPDWAKTWSRDPNGFVRVDQLALYRPSQQLSNYRFEFRGQIAERSVGWVYRAADLQNYYATQLTITKPGPLPEVALIRYQMIAGQQTERVQIPLRMEFQNGRSYKIEQDVYGSDFTTLVDDETVDFWTNDRLRAGGVGFFGSPHDRPDIYWMTVINNDDFWGKVCGILAPGK